MNTTCEFSPDVYADAAQAVSDLRDAADTIWSGAEYLEVVFDVKHPKRKPEIYPAAHFGGLVLIKMVSDEERAEVYAQMQADAVRLIFHTELNDDVEAGDAVGQFRVQL